MFPEPGYDKRGTNLNVPSGAGLMLQRFSELVRILEVISSIVAVCLFFTWVDS